MGERIVKGFSSKRLLCSLLIFLLVACSRIIMSPSDLMITRSMPLTSYLQQIAQNIAERFSTALQSNFMLAALLIPIAFLAYHKARRKKEGSADDLSKYYKPRKTSKVSDPIEQIIRIVALAPRFHFSGLIERLYKEISDVYGDIPLWVRYNVDVLSYSWSLKNIKASHIVHAYGENIYVQKFVTRLNEELQTLLKNASSNMMYIYSIETSSPNLNKHEENNEKLYPREIKDLIQKDSGASLFNGLGLLSAVILAMIANDLWRRRKASPSVDGNVTGEMGVMQNAIEMVKELGGKNQKLEKIEDCGDGWTFKFTDYEVSVNRSGFITHIRRCG